MLCISDLIMITSTTTSPIIIPVSSIVHVQGKNYDESIVLTSKYNQVIFFFFFWFRLFLSRRGRGKKKQISVFIKHGNFPFDL
jgi:hypothetical protein